MAFSDQVLGEMKELTAQNFSEEATYQFFQKHSLKDLLGLLLSSDLTLDQNFVPRNTMLRLIEKKDVFLGALSDPELQKVIEAFVACEDEEQREFLAQIIASHADTAEELLITNAESPESATISGFIKTLYYLLKDREPQVGLKISKLLVRLAARMRDEIRMDYLVDGKTSSEIIQKLLDDSEAVIEIRTFETLVQMGNANPRLYSIFEKFGYITCGLNLYRKYFDEILEKMNIVDVISQLGSTEEGCNILCSHPVFGAIKKEALAKETDPFVAKSLSILLIELVNHEKVAYSFVLFKNLRIRLEEMFIGGFGEELHACFDMISSFGKSVEGFNLVYQTKSVLQKLCLCCHSNKEGEQRRALTALLNLFTPLKKHVDSSKKGKTRTLVDLNEDGRHIELLLIYLYNPTLVNTVIDLNDDDYMKKTMDFILNNLMMPFIESEILFVEILKNTMAIEKVFNAWCRNSRSLEYLHMNPTKTKEMFDTKRDFKQYILHRLYSLKDTVKDSFYELYLKEYKIKEENRKQEVLQYASQTG